LLNRPEHKHMYQSRSNQS